MELTLGPILFEWKKSEVEEFYDRVCDMAVDTVYLGEVVCFKKKGLTVPMMAEIGEKLQKAGKKVVISTLAIVTDEVELNFMRDHIDLPFGVEANDMGALNVALEKYKDSGKDIYAGPHITTYNKQTNELFKDIGVKGVTYPVELEKRSLKYNVQNSPEGLRHELFAHGKAPLAYSWRCYTSKAFDHSKEDCHHDCLRDPDGIEIDTLTGEHIYTINGTSILSALTYTLVEFIEDIRDVGFNAVRISPQYEHMDKIVKTFRKRIDGELSPEEGIKALEGTASKGFCNGWYLGEAGKDYYNFKRELMTG